MLNTLKTIITALITTIIFIAVILGGVYAISFCWYSAKQVVLVNSSADLLSHITIQEKN